MDYFTHRDGSGVHDLYSGEQERERTGYLTDLISDGAVEFIGRQRGAKAPFLLSVHYTAPHWFWETRADEAESRRIERIIHTDGGSVATYLTMIRHMDEGIARILEALKAAGADEKFDLVNDSRERANQGKLDAARLEAMRARYAAWEATMPRIPEDANFSIPYAKSDVAMPGSV